MIALSTKKADDRNLLLELFSISGWLYFLLAVTMGVLNVLLIQEFVLTDEVFHNTLGERLAYDRIEKMLAGKDAYNWVGYALLPLGILLQVLAISFCLLTGVVLSASKVSFKKIFKITLVAVGIISVVRLIPTLVLMLQDIQVIDDLFSSDWYSLLALVGRDNVSSWLYVPLSALNVFHLVLVLLLAAGLHILTDKPIQQNALLGYGGGTLLWWVCLMYVQVSLG